MSVCNPSPTTHTHTHTHTHLYETSPTRTDLNFLTHFTGKGGPSIFQWSALSMWNVDWNVWVLTKSGLSFMYKMIREILLMPRVDSDYPPPPNFMVNSWVSRMTSPNLMPKSTADIECVYSWLEVRSWYGEYMHRVRPWHIVSTPPHTHACAHASSLYKISWWSSKRRQRQLFWIKHFSS